MRRVGGFVRLPSFGAGQTIGLLGGSFNPPHRGHLLATRVALRRLNLDRVWWLATPGNPLKTASELADLRIRLQAAQALVRDPRISITGFESEIGSRYTADTLRYLSLRATDARFVWVMGADNLAQFHRWRDWEEIAARVPLLVVDRPGYSFSALSSRAGQALARWRRCERDAGNLPFAIPPAWVFLHGPRSATSSTALRRAAP